MTLVFQYVSKEVVMVVVVVVVVGGGGIRLIIFISVESLVHVRLLRGEKRRENMIKSVERRSWDIKLHIVSDIKVT